MTQAANYSRGKAARPFRYNGTLCVPDNIDINWQLWKMPQ
jgi:hypothetical protein